MKTDWKQRAQCAEANLEDARGRIRDLNQRREDLFQRERRETFRARIFRGLRLWPTRYRLVLLAGGDLFVWHDAEHCSWALRRVLGPIFRLDRELWLR